MTRLAEILRVAIFDILAARGARSYLSGGRWCVELLADKEKGDDDLPRLAEALLASGVVVPRPDGWQWGVRYPNGYIDTERGWTDEATARRVFLAIPRCLEFALMRRTVTCGPWEEVPSE